MHYLIDGYNVLFRNLKSNESLQKQRNDLIEEIELAVRILKLNVAIVFDSQYQKTEGSRHHLGDLEIIYTDTGETADEYILKKLKNTPTPYIYTVVTSDKVLSNQCRYRLAKTLPVDEFLTWIKKRQKNIIAIKKEKPIPLVDKPLARKLIKKEPLPKEAKKLNPKQRSIEDYEKIFAQEFDKLEEEKPKTKTQTQKAKKSDRPLETDMERWLKAFSKDDTHKNK